MIDSGGSSADLAGGEAACTGNVRSVFGWLAGDNPAQIIAYAAAHAKGPNLWAIFTAFSAVGSHLPLDLSKTYRVAFQVRGTTYNIQIADPDAYP
jgi:hypothetical protein